MNCGDCLMNDAKVVEIVDNKCPECGRDYSTIPPPPKAFETWTFKGVRFLAFPNGQNFHVVDEHGGNFGSWWSADQFRKRQQKGVEEIQELGKVALWAKCL